MAQHIVDQIKSFQICGQKVKIYNCLKIACHKIQDRAYETVKMCMVRTLHGKLLG